MLEELISIINQLLPEPHASLLAGMLFGVKRSMPDDFYENLITTGTLHVIALSGMNVSIIIRLLFNTVGPFAGKYGSFVITTLAIIGFVILVGPSATIIRASIMGILSILAVLLGRKDIPMISLFITVVTMIFYDRTIVGDISFQLSVCATLGIIMFSGTSIQMNKSTIQQHDLTKIHHSIFTPLKLAWGFIRDDLRVTFSAQVFTVPLILFYFQRISIVSPLANVLTGWLIAPITYLGFITVFFASIWFPLGRVFSLVTWVPLTLFIWIVEVTSKLPFASLEL